MATRFVDNFFKLIPLYLLLCCTVNSQPVFIKEECDARTCYYLYRDSSRPAYTNSWDICSSKGQHLAFIRDAEAQATISKFKHYNGEELIRPFLAARRSSDAIWRTANNTIVTGIDYDKQTNFGCTAYHTINGSYTIFAVPCIIPTTTTTRYPACQKAPENGECHDGSTRVLDACYRILPTPSSYAQDAQLSCRQWSSNSHLAYTNIATNNFRDFVIPSSRNSTNLFEIWIGIFRSWSWLVNGPNGREEAFTYENWRPGFGSDDECLVIDIKNDYTWLDNRCDEGAYYVLCQGPVTTTDGSTSGTVSPVTTTDGSTSGTSTSTTVSPEPSSDGGETLDTKSIIIIACVCGGVVLLIVIIITAICATRSKNRKRKSHKASRNGNYQHSISEVSSTLDSRPPEVFSVVDSTNRDLTPMDFNLMWQRKSEVPKKKEKYTPEYANDGFRYDNGTVYGRRPDSEYSN